jgi:NAD dependent epimerase/dehydratase
VTGVNWSGRRVLVTGAGGFIGSHLTERLVGLGASTRALVRYTSSGGAGWLDRSPVRGEIDVIAGDITDGDIVRKATEGVDVVFHLAALIGIPYSYHAPESYVRTNVDGTLNVLQRALAAGVSRVVHTSTSEVYGTAQRVPIAEDHPLQTQSPYSATKAAADLLAVAFQRSFGLPVVTLRPFNTYGPRQSARAVIPTIITQALTQPVVRLGHLDPTRDFTFVSDTVDAFVLAASVDALPLEPINVGSGKEIAIRDLAALIASLIGGDVSVAVDDARVRPERSEVDRLCADATRARQLLGWSPRHSLRDGLQATIAWIKDNLERYRPETYSV